MSFRLLIVWLSVGLVAQAETPKEIMQKVIDRDDGRTQYNRQLIATCKYRLQGKKLSCVEKPRVKLIESARKDYGANGRDIKTVMIIRKPAAEKGIGFLQFDYDDDSRDTDQWMYLASLGKIKRIVSGNSDEPKTGSLFGSEFNYEDTERPQLNHYLYALVKEEAYQGRPVWVIQSQPKPEYARKSNYSKTVQWIDKQRYLTLKSVMYDRHGKIVKILTLSDYLQEQGVWVARKMNMMNVQSKRVTTMKLDKVALNITITDELLSQRTLTDKAFREHNLAGLRKNAKVD